jgi:hypothetical protein
VLQATALCSPTACRRIIDASDARRSGEVSIIAKTLIRDLLGFGEECKFMAEMQSCACVVHCRCRALHALARCIVHASALSPHDHSVPVPDNTIAMIDGRLTLNIIVVSPDVDTTIPLMIHLSSVSSIGSAHGICLTCKTNYLE